MCIGDSNDSNDSNYSYGSSNGDFFSTSSQPALYTTTEDAHPIKASWQHLVQARIAAGHWQTRNSYATVQATDVSDTSVTLTIQEQIFDSEDLMELVGFLNALLAQMD